MGFKSKLLGSIQNNYLEKIIKIYRKTPVLEIFSSKVVDPA